MRRGPGRHPGAARAEAEVVMTAIGIAVALAGAGIRARAAGSRLKIIATAHASRANLAGNSNPSSETLTAMSQQLCIHSRADWPEFLSQIRQQSAALLLAA